MFPADAEHASILAAVEAVAKQYSRRGDAEGAQAVMVHVLVGLRKYDGPLLLLELVPAARTLDEIGSSAKTRAPARAVRIREQSARAARGDGSRLDRRCGPALSRPLCVAPELRGTTTRAAAAYAEGAAAAMASRTRATVGNL